MMNLKSGLAATRRESYELLGVVRKFALHFDAYVVLTY